jgi:hypothetical protein
LPRRLIVCEVADMSDSGGDQSRYAELTLEAALTPRRGEHLSAWLDLTCRNLSGTVASIIVTPGHEPESFQLSASWPSQTAALRLVPFSEHCLASREVLVQDLDSNVVVAIPLLENGRLHGALVLAVTASLYSANEIQTAAMVAARYLNHILLGNAGNTEEAGHAFLRQQKELLQLICRPDVFPKASLEVVNWMAARFGCVRVALGMAQRDRIRLQAISHSAWFDRKSQAATRIENAMEEALAQRRSVVLPALPGSAGVIALAHREAAQGGAVCSVVLAGGAGLGAGIVFLERDADRPFLPAEVAALEDIGQLIGPMLETKQSAYRWIGHRSVQARHTFVDRLRDPRRPALRAGVAIGIMMLAGLAFIDTTWRVNADAAIEGEQQRVIPAPFEGYISSAAVKAGMVVRKGQPLAELDTRQISLDLERWSAEEAQHDSRYRDALVKHDRPAAAMSMAQLQQAQAQRTLAEDRLNKAKMVAPFDGYVVSGDLSQHIGSPVELGKVLFEIAPLESYRVIVKVDERDIRAVQVGQPGVLVLSGLAEERLPFRVKNISVPEAVDGRNTFRVEADLGPARSALRPGMQGVAKINVGERGLLWIWTHSTWQWLQLQAWKWQL